MDPRIAAIEEGYKRSDLPAFAPGDTVRVRVRVKEGAKERIQPFEGVCIARRGAGVNATFTLRRISAASASSASSRCTRRGSRGSRSSAGATSAAPSSTTCASAAGSGPGPRAEVVARQQGEQLRESPGRPAAPLDYEERGWSAGCRVVVGIDEVGLGPVAGPVIVGAVALHRGQQFEGCTDSKLVPPARREELARRIRAECLAWRIAAASTREIERLNVRAATIVAMRRALDRLPVEADLVLVDGRPSRTGRTSLHCGRRPQVPLHRLRLDPGQGDARPAHAPARRAIPALRLGLEQGVSDSGAHGCDPATRPDAAPPRHVPGRSPDGDGAGPRAVAVPAAPPPAGESREACRRSRRRRTSSP